MSLKSIESEMQELDSAIRLMRIALKTLSIKEDRILLMNEIIVLTKKRKQLRIIKHKVENLPKN